MSESKTVLIVDDEPMVRYLIQAVLADSGLRLLEASNGVDALAVAEQERPHVVLLDVGMPGLNGLEVCRRLKVGPSTCGIAVMMLTALAQETDRDAAHAAGADAYITKPFKPLELRAEVDQLLARL